jgi:hypothetical protein
MVRAIEKEMGGDLKMSMKVRACGRAFCLVTEEARPYTHTCVFASVFGGVPGHGAMRH